MNQGLEAVGARRVVFEVVSVDVQVLDELSSNSVVATFGEVP